MIQENLEPLAILPPAPAAQATSGSGRRAGIQIALPLAGPLVTLLALLAVQWAQS
jgi:hypothetical protein